MKLNDVMKQLLPGLIVGFILGLGLVSLVGVNTEEIVPNIIGIMMSCAVPTLLNGIIVLKGTSRVLKKDLSIGDAFLLNIPYIIIAAIIGFVFARGVLMGIFGLDLRTFKPILNTLINASFGCIVSTVLGYFALRMYEKNVK